MVNGKAMGKTEYFTISELATLLGLSRVAVFKRIQKGEIKAIKISKIYAIPKTELLDILGKILTKKQKIIIDKAVKKTIQEYGETLKLLGNE
jgi:excisionase family DNA binding protein